MHRDAFGSAFGARGGRCGGRRKDLRPLRPLPFDQAGRKQSRTVTAGVFDRKSGTEPGYSYSSAVKGLNVTWDETNLNEWLQGPSKFAKGTKMIYLVPDEKDRQDVIAYLKTLPK